MWFVCSLSAVNFGIAGSADAGVGQAFIVIAGLITVANSIFNAYVICNHPSFRSDKKKDLNDEVRLACTA